MTKDPEFRKTENDVSVCTFTIACNRRPKPNGEREADFLNIVVWRGQADNCYRYLKKGRRVAVSGTIQTRSYDKNGERRYVTEIVADEVEFLSTKNEREEMTEVQTDDYPF